MNLYDIVAPMSIEEAKAKKQRLDAKCWKGYKKQGTKVKGGVRVNNCVPMESQITELAAGYAANKGYDSLGKYKRYNTFISKKKFNNIAFIAVAENPRDNKTVFRVNAPTQQEAVQKLHAEIDKQIDVATKVSGSATIDFNVDFAKDILELSSNTFYAKIVSGPKLVIAGKEMEQYPDIMKQEGFRASSIRTVSDSEGTTKLPAMPLSASAATTAQLIANGRYVLGAETIDRDGNRVFDLEFDSVVADPRERIRMGVPAITIGTKREAKEDAWHAGDNAWSSENHEMVEATWDDEEDDWEEESDLRSGDYVRDSQEGEYGEVFRMVGDPQERRVQILDRDGRGWYITTDRLVPVDPDDPAIQRYFGKKRVRDIDESNVADQVKKVFKDKAGKPVGEIGIDPESSPGNDEWYVHHYATGYSVVGFDSAAEAKRELLYVHKHPDSVEGHPSTKEQGVAESATAPIIVPKRKAKEKQPAKFHIPYSADDYVPPAVALARDEEAKKKKGVAEGWSNKMVARRTGQAPTPYSVFIKGKKWKDFADDDHAEAVANKLRAKFKADGRDPSVITVAPTDYDVEESTAKLRAKGLTTKQDRFKSLRKENVQESYWTRLQNERNTKLNTLVNELKESIKK